MLVRIITKSRSPKSPTPTSNTPNAMTKSTESAQAPVAQAPAPDQSNQPPSDTPSNTSSKSPSEKAEKATSQTSVQSDTVETNKADIDFTKGGVDNYKFYPDNPENHRHKYRWVHKEPTKFYDPCEESRQASINCVLRNQEDRSVCQDFFDAYKECRRDFFKKKRDDRVQGKGGWGFW